MAESFDAVVIGAGVGGLVAAGVMARAGRRVLALDRAHHPGGTAHVFRRGAYSFPMGPLGFSSPAIMADAFARMGATAPPLDRVRYRLRAFGLDLPLSHPLAEVAAALAAAYPADASGIRIFFDRIEAIGRALDHPGGERERALLGQAAAVSALEYLKGLVGGPAPRRILGSIGTHEAYSGLPLLAAMWRLMCRDGIWSPRGGMGALTGALLSGVRSAGAEVRLGAEVEAIRVRDGRVAGVTVAGGEQIEAAAVVSDADYKATFLRLVPRQHLSDEFFQAVVSARQTGSALQVAVGLDPAAADLSAFDQCDRIIYRRAGNGPGLDWRAAEVDPAAFAGEELEISLWTRPGTDDGSPRPAAGAGAALVIRVEADHGHFARYRPGPGKRLPSYSAYKEKLAAALIAEAGAVVPSLAAAVRVTDVATPLTFEERGGRSAGSIAGWSWDFDSGSDLEPRELVLTPIAGLYMAGCQAFSGLFLGGVPTAALAGIRAAEAAIAGAGPETLALPG